MSQTIENQPVMTFTAMYNKYHNDILNFISFRINNLHVAEEITNDVFIKANKYTHDAAKSNIRTWLRTIAITCISDHFRVDHSELFTNIENFQDDKGNETFTVSDTCKTESMVESMEFKAMIERAFETLKPNYKRIATLFFLSELSHAEIVEVTELPLNTVKVMIGRCREMLQKELQIAKSEYLPK